MKAFNELFDLSGKTAIVTGGANGIGKATAMRLAQAGANIVIADLNLNDAEQAVKEIEQQDNKALAVECNILKDDNLVNLVEITLQEFGGIHVLIDNAGGGGGGRENPFKISVDYFSQRF